MGEPEGVTPARTLDVRGASCPMPVVKTAQAIRELETGAVLEVLATDAGVDPDMRSWTRQTGNELVSIDERDGVYRVLVRKA